MSETAGGSWFCSILANLKNKLLFDSHMAFGLAILQQECQTWTFYDRQNPIVKKNYSSFSIYTFIGQCLLFIFAQIHTFLSADNCSRIFSW